MSEWNYEKKNIFKHIAKKYSLPRLITQEEAIGRIVESVFAGETDLYIIFDDNACVRVSSERGWEGEDEVPSIGVEVDWDYIHDMAKRDVQSKTEIPQGYESPFYVEMIKLIAKFDSEERERQQRAEYLRLKDKFGEKEAK